MRSRSIEHTQCHGTRRGVRGSGDFTRKFSVWCGYRADAAGWLATDSCAARRLGPAYGYRNRRRTQRLGETTDEAVKEIGKLVTQ
jgi:hypothetical protein